MLEFITTHLANGARRLSAAGAMRRLVRRQDGSAAVEFGLVAAPFLALVFAIMETSVIFFAGQALETAVADSSRLIMTGQAQTQNPPMSADDFKAAVCAKIYGLFDCQNTLYVDVQTFTSFDNMTLNNPVDAQGNYQNLKYQPGVPGSIVVVRLFYQWPVYVSLLDLKSSLSNVAGGKRLLAA